MTDLKEEAGRLILETSKLAVEAIIGVLKNLQNDKNQHNNYTIQHLQDVQFLCQVIRPYSGHAARFPPDLAPHLQAADQALKELEKLFNEAKELQGWNPKKIVQKIWEAPEFKQKFDVQLEHLHTHWNEFNSAGRKGSILMAWEEIFLRYPHAGLFWLTIARTETKITYDRFYDELIIACGGNRKKTGNYPSLFLKGYIYEYMCETKTNLDTTTLITVHSFKTWIGTNSNDDNELELKDLVEKALVQIAVEGPEFDSPARRLYQRAKGLLNDAQTTNPPNRPKLEEAQKLFEEYRMNVEEKVPLLRDPKEDRHLYYLMEIERLLYPNLVNNNTTAGNAFQKWQKWSKDFGTKSPKQKAQAAAVNHYYQGEAYVRKAQKLLGEEVEDDKKAEETWSKLPRYKKTLMNAWTSEDITQWLEDLKYSEYIPIFTENHIDGQILMSISDDEFKTELKIEKLFHRRSLLNFIKAFSPQTQPLINTLKVDEDDVLWLLQSARAEFDVYKNVLQDSTDEKKNTSSEKSRGKATAVLGDKSDYYLTEIQRLEQRIAIQALTNRGSGVASSASPQKTT